ncbi:DNA polymerase II, family B [Methanocaldococcus bathoardescens]|uniref:DNA-directed DNA polymerase n=1 Tax=Methanocaldococcus bathoardescens TaxID=1301915 RepID=A0A076LBT2_9EURY|nr:DNA polymerase II, family B [Methanocaldococcus bathoardescens]
MEKIDTLIDNTYKTVDDRAIIYLYLINSILKDRDFKPYFYVELNKDKVKDEDIETIKDFLLKNDLLKFVENIEVVKKIILRNEKEVIKIIATHPQKVPKLRKLRECPIVKEIYEHDIPFAKRYLIDNEIIPMTYWDFENKKPVSIEIPKLKAVAFDMEVYNRDTEPDPERDPILMASFWDENGGKVVTYKEFDHPNIEVVENEKELIKRIIETLKQYDIIYTYNGDNFDFPYLKARAKLYGINIELGRDKEELKIKRGGMEYRSYIPGRVHIDLYPISRRLLKLTKYTLEDVVYNLFGIEKLKIPHTKIVDYWVNNDKNLIEYSLQDAKYTYKVGNYFFPLEVMFSRIVNQTLFEITRMTSGQMVEYLLMKNAFKENMMIPNKPDEEEYRRRLSTTYEGGYVKEPEKGMFEDIISMDFRSLYPSIIISYNISPDTLDCECCKDISEKILGHWFCKKKEGLIPKTLRNLIERRIKIKKKMKKMKDVEEINEEYNLLDYEQKSLKILANSHYGYLAFPRARFYSRECAEVVTYLGRKYIQQTMEEAEKFGFKVIYADSVTEDTEIIVKINNEIKFIKIKDLFKKVDYTVGEKEYCILNSVYALTLDDNGKLVWKKVPYVMRHKANKEVYRVWITNSWHIDVTEDHSLIGYKNKKFIEIKPTEIKEKNISLIALDENLKEYNFVNVKKVEKINYNGYVYDIEVEDTHRFFANGILVHNTDGFYAIWKEKISKDELIKKALEFVDYINSKLPGTMELEFEGYFKRGIFVTKKRYALIDENGRVTVKGLEFVRRDWSNIAKITQRKVLETLLVEGSIEKAKKIIQDVIKDLREKKIKKEDLIIYTQLTKDPKEYKTTAPHVEIAKKLMREGKRIKVGDIIGYIIVKGTKSISERAKLPEEVDIEDVDVNYYIDNQILPPVLRIMEAVGVSKNELKKEGAQLTLDRFLFK